MKFSKIYCFFGWHDWTVDDRGVPQTRRCNICRVKEINGAPEGEPPKWMRAEARTP